MIANKVKVGKADGAQKRAVGCMGFSLLELPASMAVILLPMAILLPWLSRIREEIHKKKTLTECVMLANAIKEYRNVFTHYSLQTKASTNDHEYKAGVDPNLLIDEMRHGNLKKEQFLNISNKSRKDGVWQDPWGKPYQVYTDLNADYNVLVNDVVQSNVEIAFGPFQSMASQPIESHRGSQ